MKELTFAGKCQTFWALEESKKSQAPLLAIKWFVGILAMSDDEAKTFIADYPFDLLAVKQLIFVYSVIIEYQHIGDTKTPLIRVIDSNQRLKNDSLFEI